MRSNSNFGKVSEIDLPIPWGLFPSRWLGMPAAALLLMLLGPSMLAQESTDNTIVSEALANESTAEQNPTDAPTEIVVTPMLQISDLRKLMAEAEDDTYAKYNELNLDDDYDIMCWRSKPTMSHITRRTCEPLFLTRERSDNHGFALLNMARKNGVGFGIASELQLKLMLKREYEELQRRMAAFTSTDPEFRALMQKLLDLRAAVEERYK